MTPFEQTLNFSEELKTRLAVAKRHGRRRIDVAGSRGRRHGRDRAERCVWCRRGRVGGVRGKRRCEGAQKFVSTQGEGRDNEGSTLHGAPTGEGVIGRVRYVHPQHTSSAREDGAGLLVEDGNNLVRGRRAVETKIRTKKKQQCRELRLETR
jgi:hypothetical protein